LNAVNAVSVLLSTNNFDLSLSGRQVHVLGAGNGDSGRRKLTDVVELSDQGLQFLWRHREVSGLGPNVTIVSADDCVGHGPGGQELVVDV